eukprot:2465993-Alexandrium_andersonii.AAC.1
MTASTPSRTSASEPSVGAVPSGGTCTRSSQSASPSMHGAWRRSAAPSEGAAAVCWGGGATGPR